MGPSLAPRPLSQLAQVQTGPFGTQLHAHNYREHGTPIITVEHLGDNEVLHANLPLVADEDVARLSKYILREGDIVFSRVGAIDRRAYVSRAEDGWLFSGRLLRVRPSAEVDGRCLSYRLGHGSSVAWIRNRAVGSTMACLNTKILSDLPIDLPPLTERRQIAVILDTIDDAIRKTEQIIAKLKQVQQGLLHDLLTRGIDDNGELRDPKRNPEQFKDSPVGQIPRRWETATLEQLTTRIVDGVHHTPTYVEQGIPFLTVQNLTWGPGVSLDPRRHVSVRAHAEYRRRADPGEGDVLVTKDGTLGVARVVPPGLPEFSIFVSLALLRPAAASIKAELVAAFFETSSYQRQLGRQSAGTGLKHIHLEHFREFQLAVPPMAEQDRIVTGLSSSTNRLAVEEEQLSKLRILKSGLMEDLLTGRVRVTKLLETAAE